jgi:DNA-directed RNA polymerase specialized sigma24 family protein
MSIRSPVFFRGATHAMNENELIPHLFRTEYRKLIAVIGKLFGMEHIETAEDLVRDTFLQAA